MTHGSVTVKRLEYITHWIFLRMLSNIPVSDWEALFTAYTMGTEVKSLLEHDTNRNNRGRKKFQELMNMYKKGLHPTGYLVIIKIKIRLYCLSIKLAQKKSGGEKYPVFINAIDYKRCLAKSIKR